MANMGEKGVFTGGKSWSGTRVGLRGLTGVDPGGQKVSELGSQGSQKGYPLLVLFAGRVKMGCHSGTPILRGLILGPSGTMANMG